MSATLEPDPEFTRQLEWQLRTELRRRARFGESQARSFGDKAPGGKRSLPRRLVRSAALLLVPILLGGAGMAAVGHYQGRDARARVEARAELQLHLAERREEQASDELARVELRFSNGLVGDWVLIAARARTAEQRTEVSRRALDLEEVRGSGRAPQHGLAAPLVRGLDYVSTRLELSRLEASERAEHARRLLERSQARVDNGLVGEHEPLRHAADVAQAALEQEQVARQLELRARYLLGELTGLEVELLADIELASAELERARVELSLTQQLLTRREARFQGGLVSRLELESMRLRLEESEGRILLAELELEVLQAELGR